MTQIPAGTKFIGISASYPTTERKSALNNSYSEIYTIEDLNTTIYDVANVTQTNNALNAVTVNATSGIITTQGYTTPANSCTLGGSFVVNNTRVKSTSKILLTCQYLGSGNGIPVAYPKLITDNQFQILICNGGGDALNASIKIHFTIID
jgi:hypothetical protein